VLRQEGQGNKSEESVGLHAAAWMA
jgi:hypothetical protein